LRFRRVASWPVIAAFLLALTIAIALAASMPITDPYSTLNTQWNGTSTLAEKGFRAVSADFTTTIASAGGAGVLLIIGPSRQFTRVEADFLADFVQKGGLLFLADNFGSGNSLLGLLGLPVRFDGKLLADALFYRNQPAFPVISDFSSSEFSTGVNELVLDYATVLDILDGSNIKVLARSSPFSFLDLNQNGHKDSGEPSGPFPVLAELEIGRGAVVVFTSPASLANGLIHEANNVRVIENVMNTTIVGQASQPEHRTMFLLDETHLMSSPFTSVKLMADGLVTSILKGDMQLSWKLSLTAFASVIVVARYIYRKPPTEVLPKTEIRRTVRPTDVESVMRLHPTWDREKLECVAREIEASMKWRVLHEGE